MHEAESAAFASHFIQLPQQCVLTLLLSLHPAGVGEEPVIWIELMWRMHLVHHLVQCPSVTVFRMGLAILGDGIFRSAAMAAAGGLRAPGTPCQLQYWRVHLLGSVSCACINVALMHMVPAGLEI